MRTRCFYDNPVEVVLAVVTSFLEPYCSCLIYIEALLWWLALLLVEQISFDQSGLVLAAGRLKRLKQRVPIGQLEWCSEAVVAMLPSTDRDRGCESCVCTKRSEA